MRGFIAILMRRLEIGAHARVSKGMNVPGSGNASPLSRLAVTASRTRPLPHNMEGSSHQTIRRLAVGHDARASKGCSSLLGGMPPASLSLPSPRCILALGAGFEPALSPTGGAQGILWIQASHLAPTPAERETRVVSMSGLPGPLGHPHTPRMAL